MRTALRTIILAIREAWNPATALFGNGEVGVFYDPSDFSTLFQDSAGTTPVTAVEQPVGLILDKSKGLVLGAELVTNGDFSNGTTGYTGSNATVSASNGELTITSTGANANARAEMTLSGLVVGKTYEAVVRAKRGATGTDQLIGAWVPFEAFANTPVATTEFVNYPYRIKATATSGILRFYVSANVNLAGASLVIDNISVRELPGFHASQSTAASRPTLSQRVNLLTKTEDFSNAAWTKDAFGTGTAPTASSGFTDPDSGATAWRLQLNRGAGTTSGDISRMYALVPANASGICVFWLKSNDANSYSIQVGFGGGAVTKTVTPTWTLFSVPQAGQTDFDLILRGSIGASATADILIWHPQVVPADQASLPYQRVDTATSYDTSSVFPRYLKFDGVDDSLSTASIDFSGGDKMTVVAGVRANASTSGMLLELSANVASNAGSFYLFSTSTGPEWALVGNAAGVLLKNPSAFSSNSLVIDAAFNIAGATPATELVTKANGVTSAATVGTAGTGNFGNYPLFVGRRAGTSLPFSGHLYGLVVRGSQSTDAQIVSAEAYMNSKTGAY